MISRISLRHRPIKIVYRELFTNAAFVLPCPGWWRVTCVAGGGGSGSTHASYAAPSERGSNGQVYNPGDAFLRQLPGVMSLGAGGVGGTLTNNSDVAAQRGKVGGDSYAGVGATLTGGAGGRCAYEQAGLNPSPPIGPYPTGIDDRTVNSERFLGVLNYGGGAGISSGGGAAGNAAPGTAAAGQTGRSGRADYYLRG